jgi:DNA-binding transcriptional ArsR family regulator
MEQFFHFLQVPSLVVLDKRLSDGAFRTYMVLLASSMGKNECFPGIKTLADDRGVTRQTILNHIKELEEAELITKKRRGFTRTNCYKIESISAVYAKPAQGSEPVATNNVQPCDLTSGTEDVFSTDDAVLNEGVIQKTSLVVSQESIKRAKHRAKKRQAEEARKREDRARNNKDKKKKNEADSTRVYRLWSEKYSKKWPMLDVPKWYVKEKSVAKRLITHYGLDKVFKAVEYTFDNWEDLSERLRTQGPVPTIGFVSVFKDIVFTEMEIGKYDGREARRRKAVTDDEYEDSDSGKSITSHGRHGWGVLASKTRAER